jgi:hypothetical protein
MKFFLVDAMSLVFRAYHAMAKMNLQAPNGELTGAVFGFANILSTVLNKDLITSALPLIDPSQHFAMKNLLSTKRIVPNFRLTSCRNLRV